MNRIIILAIIGIKAKGMSNGIRALPPSFPVSNSYPIHFWQEVGSQELRKIYERNKCELVNIDNMMNTLAQKKMANTKKMNEYNSA